MPSTNIDAESEPGTDHEYIRIRPSDDSLPAERLAAQFEQLHDAVRGHVVEVLLVADPDDEVTYYIGTDPGALPSLRRVLHRIFSDEYALVNADDPPALPDGDDIAVAELHGLGDRRKDWQTRLRPPALSDAPEQHQTPRVQDAPGLPLESVVEGLHSADGAAVYQALIRPRPSWSHEAEYRIDRIEHNEDTLGQRLFKTVFGPVDSEDETSNDGHRRSDGGHRAGDARSVPGSRIDAILAKSATHSFDVNARVLVAGDRAEATARSIASAFEAIGGDYYGIRPIIHTDEPANTLVDAVREPTLREGDSLRHRLKRRFPLAPNNDPRIVADATTVAHFCLFDGQSLTDRGRRALRALPGERTGVTPPDASILDHYTGDGLPIGYPVDAGGSATDRTVSLPPTLQPLHVAWFGKTGAGKTTSLVNAIVENTGATDGADIVIAPKGDGMPRELLRAHYATYDDLDDVYYFDCTETLPAISFFDIRDQLAAGISRTTAVEDVVDHYIDILRSVMGAERFDQAVRSPDIIRYLVKALFDPEYGNDAFTHRDLLFAVRQLRDSKTPPTVSDPDLQAMLEGVTDNADRTFDELMQGVANRVEKIPLDDRLARVFNHMPDDGTDPHFDFQEVLDEDGLVIIDTGGLRSESQRVLALVLLSNFWTALRRRTRQHSDDDLPLVNLYLEEASSIAVSDLFGDLLAQSRGFGLSVTMAMQFPAQLREESEQAYDEVLNNVSTIVTGNVPVDDALAKRFATDDMAPEDVGNRLRSLRRGQWFATLPAPFDEPEPQPFLVESLELPAGHPEGDQPLSQARQTGFDALREVTAERTWRDHGIRLDLATDQGTDTGVEHPQASTDEDAPAPEQIQSALPYTNVLPRSVAYLEDAHALQCTECETRYDPTCEGIERAVECCDSLDAIDRDTVSICDINLTLSSQERQASPYSGRQLAYLQAVHTIQQQRYSVLEFDMLRDSMTLLREYLNIDREAVQQLVDDGLLSHDCDRPHRLYSVTPEGRDELKVGHREGLDHGAGEGDLTESTEHILGVELGARLMHREIVEPDDTAAVEVKRYYEPEGYSHRLDVAAVDADGGVVGAAEAERINNDTRRAVVADYEKLAAHDPEAAVWISTSPDAAHEILAALNDPQRGDPKVEKSYNRGTRPKDFSLDQPGCTAIRTTTQLHHELVDADE